MGAERNDLVPGMTLGTHRLERLLGRGGMGAVFLAYDTQLHRQVAIKVIESDDADDPNLRARLLREARNAAALNHPHICIIHEVGEADGTAFIAMEYVAGRSLREQIDEAALPLADVVRLGVQAADALAYAHSHGVVHRDFKAANAIVGENGWLKLVDFGLARRDEAGVTEATTFASVVPAGAVAGTPYAMAPEQIRGEPADARTDIWALGVLLHESVSGERPFTGKTTPELFSSILTTPPAPLPGRLPGAFRAVVERCLEKDPARRYQRAEDVRAALEAIASGATRPWIEGARPLHRQKGVAAAGALVLLGALLIGTNAGGLRDRLLGGVVDAAPLRLAVLPLEDVSGDPGQEYFAAGMHDALITDLARIDALRVTARASALRYSGTQKSIAEIAKELSVDAVLTGSLARSGDRVRITAQLIDGASENHLWTQRYDRTMREVLSLQNEIVAAIAREVRLKLTPEEQSQLADARPVDPQAHEAYLRGTFFLSQSTPVGVEKGMTLLHEAVTRDPLHPLSYAHLAAGYATLGHGRSPPPGAFSRARGAALKALELDDGVALAHTVLGELILYGERTWDWPEAEQSFQRAIELNPTLARAHAHYAWYLILFGRWEEALASMRRAREVDPLAPLWPAWEGYLYWEAGRPDEAIRAIRTALELNPDYSGALNYLGFAYASQGKYEEALAEHRRAGAINPAGRWPLGYTYALAGRRAEARAIAAELERTGEDPYRVAIIHATLGSVDEAFRWLETAYEQRNSNIPWIASTPGLRSLRNDSRFADLLRRMKLPG